MAGQQNGELPLIPSEMVTMSQHLFIAERYYAEMRSTQEVQADFAARYGVRVSGRLVTTIIALYGTPRLPGRGRRHREGAEPRLCPGFGEGQEEAERPPAEVPDQEVAGKKKSCCYPSEL